MPKAIEYRTEKDYPKPFLLSRACRVEYPILFLKREKTNTKKSQSVGELLVIGLWLVEDASPSCGRFGHAEQSRKEALERDLRLCLDRTGTTVKSCPSPTGLDKLAQTATDWPRLTDCLTNQSK